MNDPTWHKGDMTPLPVGGARQPESMPTEYDPSSFVERPTEFGPEYEAVVRLRDTFTELKKGIALN